MMGLKSVMYVNSFYMIVYIQVYTFFNLFAKYIDRAQIKPEMDSIFNCMHAYVYYNYGCFDCNGK